MSKIQIINAPTDEYGKRQFKIVETIDHQKLLYKAQPINSNIHDGFVTIKIIQQLDKKQKIRFPQVLEILKGSKTWTQIVTVYDYFEQANQFYIVMEYGETTLKQYLQQNIGITLQQKLKHCHQICESIKFIHEKGHMHRDIRPENFVVIKNIIKLTDFGIMRDDPPENCEYTVVVDPTNQTYTAPEIIRQQNYDKKCDIWSLGCVFYEILTGNKLFNQNTPNSNKIQDENYISQEIKKIAIPLQFMETIQQMMNQNPENRPDIKEIIKILIDNYQIIEQQYEMIRLYNQQEKLNKWVQELKLTLKDSDNMNQDQISIFFNKLIEALQQQKFESNQQFMQNQFSNQNQTQKLNNQTSSNQGQKIENLKVPETFQQPKPIVAQQFQQNPINLQQQPQNGIQPTQQANLNFQQQPQNGIQPTQQAHFNFQQQPQKGIQPTQQTPLNFQQQPQNGIQPTQQTPLNFQQQQKFPNQQGQFPPEFLNSKLQFTQNPFNNTMKK